MISFFKERDFLNNNCSTKEKEDEKTDQKKNSKRSSFFFKESHISFARKNTTLFARHYKKTLKDGRYASFLILSLFFQSLVFSLLIFVLRLDFLAMICANVHF